MSVLSGGAEPSIWEILWDYIYTHYISPEPVYYENLGYTSDGMLNIKTIVLGLLVGLIIASFSMVINKRVLGEFIRTLLSGGCLSPESAMTLSELGFERKYVIRNGVRRGTNIRCVVKCREEEEFYASLAKRREEYERQREADTSLPPFVQSEYTVNADTDHFYIPEEKKYSAEMRFDKKGTTWLGFAVIVVVSVVLFCVLLFAIPEILKLLDELVGSFDSAPSNILT